MFWHRKSRPILTLVTPSRVELAPMAHVPFPLFPNSTGVLERALTSYGEAVAREELGKAREPV